MAIQRRRRRRTGRPASWRFAEGVEQLPLVALYVRDALGLLLEPPTGQSGQFDYDVTRACPSRQPDGIRSSRAGCACAVVVPVEGRWWHRFEPGAVGCSVHAARDSALARIILTSAFDSGLAQ